MLRHCQNNLYEIVRHNGNTLFFATETVRIVKGLNAAQRAVDRLQRDLTARERAEGWGYYCQRTMSRSRTRANRK